MLKIRLARFGRTNIPSFRVVIIDHREPAKGHYLEAVGFYNPKNGTLKINKEKITKWLGLGAKPSDRVARLLKKEGVKHKFIVIHQRPTRTPKVKKTESKEGAPQTAVTEVKKETQGSEGHAAPEEPQDKK